MADNGLKMVAVIPAYNEEHSIAQVILAAKLYVDEVFVCDDGSKDKTFAVAKDFGARVVRHSENRGKGEALRTLYKEVAALNPDIVVTVDGDGQHDPHEIPMLIKPIEAGVSEVVVGSRYVLGGRMDAPHYRMFGMRVINFLYKNVVGSHIEDTLCGFRAYTGKAFESLMQGNEKGYGIEGEQLMLASKNGFRMMEVPVSVKYRGLGATSKKSAPLQGVDLMVTLFTLFIEKEHLKYMGLPGIGLTSIGSLLGIYSLFMFGTPRFFGIPVTVFAAAALTSGVLLAFVAVILHWTKKILHYHQCLQRAT